MLKLKMFIKELVLTVSWFLGREDNDVAFFKRVLNDNKNYVSSGAWMVSKRVAFKLDASPSSHIVATRGRRLYKPKGLKRLFARLLEKRKIVKVEGGKGRGSVVSAKPDRESDVLFFDPKGGVVRRVTKKEIPFYYKKVREGIEAYLKVPALYELKNNEVIEEYVDGCAVEEVSFGAEKQAVRDLIGKYMLALDKSMVLEEEGSSLGAQIMEKAQPVIENKFFNDLDFSKVFSFLDAKRLPSTGDLNWNNVVFRGGGLSS